MKDSRVRLGSGSAKTPYITLRLIEVRSGNTWHSYLTSVLDPTVLPPYVVADLYRRRWRIEEAFNTVKRLLGLSYLWTGSRWQYSTSNLGDLDILCNLGRFRRCRC